jgi:hypothetical protein
MAEWVVFIKKVLTWRGFGATEGKIPTNIGVHSRYLCKALEYLGRNMQARLDPYALLFRIGYPEIFGTFRPVYSRIAYEHLLSL